MALTVAIGGLGPIGMPLARALDAGVEGLRLIAVSASARDQNVPPLHTFRRPPRMVEAQDLGIADVVVEAGARAEFDQIAAAAILAGRTFMPVSAGAMLSRSHLIKMARETGARIVVPSGAAPGLDMVRPLAEAPIESVTLEVRTQPVNLASAPQFVKSAWRAEDVIEPTLVFSGSAVEAVKRFPAVGCAAAALALAGVGPVRTRVEIWADPDALCHTYMARVEARGARAAMNVEFAPTGAPLGMGPISWMSALACLRGLTATMRVGS